MSFYRRRIFLNVPSSRLHIQQRIHRCYGRPNLIVSQRRRWASELVPCVSEEYSIAASYTSLAVERLLQRQTGTFVDPVDYQLACSYWNNVARWIRQSARHENSNQNPLVQHSLPIAWQLLERTVQEYGLLLQKRSSNAAASSDGGGGAFFLDPNQYVDLFEAWSERSTPRDSSPPKDLLRTLYQLTKVVQGFYLPYNAAILNAILSALIPRRPTPAALDQATTLLQVLAAASPDDALADTYAWLMRAWTVAAQQEFVAHVDAKIDALLQAHHRGPAHRHAAPYVAALSYYAHVRRNAAAVAAIYSMMQSQGCAISCHAFPELIGGWLLVDGRADAEALWARQCRAAAPRATKTKWVDLIDDDDDDELDRSTPVDAAMERRALFRSAVALLDHYRQRLAELAVSSPAADPHIIDVPPTSTTEEQQSLLQSAEQVWEQLEASEEDEAPDLDRARSLLLHIYAAVQQVRAAEALWLVIRHPDRSTDCTMMRLYQREPERVEEVLERRIAADNLPNPEEEAVDVDMVNEVLDAWMLHLFPEGTPRTSAYKIPQVTERIFQIYRRFFHPTEGVIKLLPDSATYSKVLQSLIVFCLQPLAVTVEAKERIKGILQEIQERLHSKSFQLETPMCNVILRAYLMVLGNHRRALELLQRMEQSLDGSVSTSSTDHVTSWWHGSDVPRPDRDTYMEFMKYHAQFQSVRSAKHVEQIHDRMRELSKRSKKVDTSLEPNAFSYDILLSAWAHAKLKKRSDHIWTIFQNLYNVEKIPMQPCIFATLLNYFAKSTRAEDICKAVYLLEIMEQYSEEHSIRGIKPSGRQYCMVLDGCINVGAFRNAAGVIRSMLDSYSNESQGPDEEPSHRAFGWIIQMYIDKGDFDSPFLFLHEVTEKTEHKDHLCGIQPHIGTVVHLRTKMLQSVQPLAIRPGLVQMVQSIDGYIIPNVMRARNLKKSKETPWPFQTEYPGR